MIFATFPRQLFDTERGDIMETATTALILHTARDLARMAGVPLSQVLAAARSGRIRPLAKSSAGAYLFDPLTARNLKRCVPSPRNSARPSASLSELTELTPAELQEVLASDNPDRIEQIISRRKRQPKPAPKPRKAQPAPRRRAVAAVQPKAAAPIELDNGDRLMAAKRFVLEARKVAVARKNHYRNCIGPVGELLAKVTLLPPVPTPAAALCEWRNFTLQVEAASPRIKELITFTQP